METVSKEFLKEKYNEFKLLNSKTPAMRELCKFAGIHPRKLQQAYGDEAYTKLQIECGDTPNRLILTRTPLAQILRQYGDLAIELGKLPAQSNWINKQLQPTIRGLERPPHLLKWSDIPMKFKNWVETENASGYSTVIEQIEGSLDIKKNNKQKIETDFKRLIDDVNLWAPARRRNNEEGYKVELRKHLEYIGYFLEEEYGESHFDLLVNKKFAIEIKKNPNLGEYDRLFGQLARHLQHQENIIALIMDVPSGDKIRHFTMIVDKYLNKDQILVEVINK